MSLAESKSALGQASPRQHACLRAAFVEWWAYECVFSWQQPFAELALPDVVGRPGQRGVLLLHGFRCNRGLWHRWVRCLNEQGVPHRSLSLSPPFASIDDYASQIDAAVQGLWQETGQAPVVVAHSMGGLALRAWRRATAAAPERIHHVYTLGTPHAGTLMAQLSRAPNARQMRVDSAWLQTLAASEAAVWRQRFTCFVSACDQVVCPSTRATLPDAEWISVPATGHLQLVHEPLVMQTVLARLRRESEH